MLRTVAPSNNKDHARNLIIACSHHAHIFLFFAHILFVVNHTFSATPPERLQYNHLQAMVTGVKRKKANTSSEKLNNLKTAMKKLGTPNRDKQTKNKTSC